MNSSWFREIVKSKSCYIGAFLSEEEKRKLLEICKPSFSNVHADHLTVKFNPSFEDISQFKLGEKVELKIIGIGRDDKAEALVIDTTISYNTHPHITLSTAGGVGPVYSNTLLDKGEFKKITPFTIVATLGISLGTKTFFSEPAIFHKIIIPTRPQADTLVAIFILKTFGDPFFPSVKDAKVEISPIIPQGDTLESLEEKGILALDLGHGRFDHHGKTPQVAASELVASYLGQRDNQALSKLIEYARRDDIEGKGTVSSDPLDRAFGLSGLIVVLNKSHSEHPEKVVDFVLPLLDAHYKEEFRRAEELPKEFEDRMKEGKAEMFTIRQRDKNLKVVMIDSPNPSLSGYLRSQMGGRFDVVAQWLPSMHVNVLTRPTKRIDLRSLTALVRKSEAMISNVSVGENMNELSRPGRIDSVPQWYFDPATNSLQNGGLIPRDIVPTKISKENLRRLLELGLSEELWHPGR